MFCCCYYLLHYINTVLFPLFELKIYSVLCLSFALCFSEKSNGLKVFLCFYCGQLYHVSLLRSSIFKREKFYFKCLKLAFIYILLQEIATSSSFNCMSASEFPIVLRFMILTLVLLASDDLLHL